MTINEIVRTKHGFTEEELAVAELKLAEYMSASLHNIYAPFIDYDSMQVYLRLVEGIALRTQQKAGEYNKAA